jgi:hypothetical protein
MLKLCDYFRKEKKTGDIGIEIEAEFGPRYPSSSLVPSAWGIKTDGSLALNGREFYLLKPIKIEDVPARTKKICELINGDDFDLIKNSPRTGVHVHVNVGDYSLLEYATAITSYWLIENLLMYYCGDGLRTGNNYCWRLTDVEGAVGNIVDAFDSPDPFYVDGIRYLSQNITCTRNYCSVEYRGMRGTTDHEVISTWAKALHELHKGARSFPDPDKLFEWYEATDCADILETFFAHAELEGFVQQLRDIPNYETLMRESLDMVEQFAVGMNWNRWSQRIESSWNPPVVADSWGYTNSRTSTT